MCTATTSSPKRPADGLIKMNLALQQNFQVKTEIIGPDPGQQLEARVLNRVIRWKETGITWEPDPRHVEITIEQMGLQGAMILKIPGVREEKKSDRELREVIDMIIDKNEYPHENKTIADTGIHRETNEHIESMCGKCHAKFKSRNEFFKLLEEKFKAWVGEAAASQPDVLEAASHLLGVLETICVAPGSTGPPERLVQSMRPLRGAMGAPG